MTKVNFFTPITFGEYPKSPEEKALERYDSYFNLFGWSARIIDKDALEAEWHYEKPNYLMTALKVISYFTFIIPIVVLGLKYASRANYTFTFKEVSAQPVDIDEGEEKRETKIRLAVQSLLKLNKYDEAEKLLEARAEPYIEELKSHVNSAKEKYAIIKAIDDRSFDTLQRLLFKMETSGEKDELLEKAIDKLIESDPERALEINELAYFLKSNQTRDKFKIVKALILKGCPYKNHLDTLPVSSEKDELLKLAVKAGSDHKNLLVLHLFNESFKSVKVKNEALRIAFTMLSESNADIFTKLVKKSARNQDALVIEFMKLLCEKKAFEEAQDLLTIECQSVYNRMTLFSTLTVALIDSGKIQEGIDIIKSVFGNYSAKEAIIQVINALITKELFAEIVDLIAENSSIYISDYISAFAVGFCPGIDSKYSEEYLREQIAKKLITLNLEDSAKKIWKDAA